MHRKAMHTEVAEGFHVPERGFIEGLAGMCLADDADLEAAGRLAPDQIAHMAEQAADRCPQAMDDFQGCCHGSPGASR